MKRNPQDAAMRRRGTKARGLGSLHAALALLLATVVAACAPGGAPPLRVGIPAWVPAEFGFVARDLGFFDDNSIEIVQYSSPIEMSRHFREGSLDAVALTLDFVPYWSATLPSLDIVFVMDISAGADGLVGTAAVRDLDGLRGRRVGLESSPLGAHMLLRALKAGGLSLRDVQTVSIDTEDQNEAFLEGRVDAVVTYDPDRSQLLDSGGHSLFDSGRAPGEVVDVLVVQSATARAREAELRRLVDGWLAAFAKLQDEHAATVSRLAAGLSVDSARIERALAGVRLGDLAINHELLGGSSPKLAATLKSIETMAVDAGLLRAGSGKAVHFRDDLLPNIVTRTPARLAGAAS